MSPELSKNVKDCFIVLYLMYFSGSTIDLDGLELDLEYIKFS
jgi:hypothetical protein